MTSLEGVADSDQAMIQKSYDEVSSFLSSAVLPIEPTFTSTKGSMAPVAPVAGAEFNTAADVHRVLDEPTAGLDPISSGEIDELILKLQRERQMASIVVTHDMHSAKTIANRLAILNEGDVVIEGKFEDLQQSEIEFVKEFLKQS